MFENEKLRKADIFSGSLILLLGLFIVYQAFQMPMKDSYAGVQNVWYVSPALFPMMIGTTLALLGLLLTRTALKAVGLQGIRTVFHYLGGSEFARFLTEPATIRFYAIVINLSIFVFLLVPRIDFFLAAILFLLIFFFMFYCGSDQGLPALIYQIIAGTIILSLYIGTGAAEKIDAALPFSADYLVVVAIILLVVSYFRKTRNRAELKAKYRISLLIGFLAPLTIGIIFKYFLLVPMPFEGLVVSLLDAIWYADIWS